MCLDRIYHISHYVITRYVFSYDTFIKSVTRFLEIKIDQTYLLPIIKTVLYQKYLNDDLCKKSMPIRKLEKKQVLSIISQRRKGVKLSVIADQFNITEQRICQIYSHYVKTGSPPTQKKIGRPNKEPTHKEIQAVMKMYNKRHFGVIRLTKELQRLHIQISYRSVRKIMYEKGLITPAPAKRKRRR